MMIVDNFQDNLQKSEITLTGSVYNNKEEVAGDINHGFNIPASSDGVPTVANWKQSVKIRTSINDPLN